MSERVMMYSSYPITFDKLSVAILAAGGEPVTPRGEEFGLLGRIEDGERHVLISGCPPQDAPSFQDGELPYLGQELWEEILSKLGGKPVISFHVGIGYAPRSGLLAVEFAYQCAIRWPCIVYADVFEEGEWGVKVYANADIVQLRAAGQAFTTYGMLDDDDEPVPSWPDYIARGFKMLSGKYIPPADVEAFRERWGGLQLDNFVEALKRGEGRDRLLALSVLGYSGDNGMVSVLRPWLGSSDDKERWLSTIGLGRFKDEASYPALVALLTEFFPSKQEPELVKEQARFDEWRWTVVEVLSLWNTPSVVSAFRKAYQRSVEAESFVLPHRQHMVLRRWYSFQEMLCRALGEMGAFGVFTDLHLPPVHRKIGVVNMALGFCHIEEKYEQYRLLYEWDSDEEMVKALHEILETRFGLIETERLDYLNVAKEPPINQWKMLEEDWNNL